MTFFDFLENLFIGFRPYNFVSKHLQAKSKRSNNLHKENKPQKKFMSKHRYTHTTKKWDIGNTYKK
jgi:hypothetical protein